MPIQSTNPEIGNAVAEELYERANQISKYYGVKIHIAEQCDMEYDSFEVEREMDHWTISAGLNTLDAALASYPEGFFEQLQYGYYKEVEIDLCGNLTATNIPENSNGYTRFNAFVNHDNNRHKMVLDIHNPKLQQTIFHEFSHIIDSKLDFMSRHRKVLYSEERWMKLNPADFNYANSTYIISEQCRSSTYNKWFIDLYARTFPTEDRARILEYAMSGYDWMFHSEDYAPLREKLAYYSAAIRDAFDTTGWPEVTLWEEPLNGYVYKSAA